MTHEYVRSPQATLESGTALFCSQNSRKSHQKLILLFPKRLSKILLPRCSKIRKLASNTPVCIRLIRRILTNSTNPSNTAYFSRQIQTNRAQIVDSSLPFKSIITALYFFSLPFSSLKFSLPSTNFFLNPPNFLHTHCHPER